MRDLLRTSLARSLRTLPDEDRLAAALPVVCGTALAAHCDVDHLDEGRTLHLRVKGREWLGPLLAMREVLQHDLARVSGVSLAGLHLEAARPGELHVAPADAGTVAQVWAPQKAEQPESRRHERRRSSL